MADSINHIKSFERQHRKYKSIEHLKSFPYFLDTSGSVLL